MVYHTLSVDVSRQDICLNNLLSYLTFLVYWLEHKLLTVRYKTLTDGMSVGAFGHIL